VTDAGPRRIAVTGTPGTGKTTATEQLTDRGLDTSIIHLNDEIKAHELWSDRDVDRESLITDFEAVEAHLGEWDGILESHLAHHFEADRVVVLRCAPADLESRLTERGDPTAKARENAESEALDVVLSEAVDRHGRESVYEIDTTDRSPDEVADEIAATIEGEREPSAGEVDFTEYLVS